jgi:formate hydrogenlyase subunit 3/multisubunit Na+/H+ antiporter MnhD subunit
VSVILLLAGVSVTLSYARGIAALFRREPTPEEEGLPPEETGPREGQAAIVFLSLGVVLVLVLGLFPQMLMPAIAQAAEAFVK